jgi:hypothetical protein
MYGPPLLCKRKVEDDGFGLRKADYFRIGDDPTARL